MRPVICDMLQPVFELRRRLIGNLRAVSSAEGFFIHVYVERATCKPQPLSATIRRAQEAILVNLAEREH